MSAITALVRKQELRVSELEDLARNLAGLDDSFLSSADHNAMRKTIIEWRKQARELMS